MNLQSGICVEVLSQQKAFNNKYVKYSGPSIAL